MLQPLSPPSATHPPLAGQETPFERLEVPSATEEQWRDWEEATKEAMERFEREQRARSVEPPELERERVDEGEEIRFDQEERREQERREYEDQEQQQTIRLVQ